MLHDRRKSPGTALEGLDMQKALSNVDSLEGNKSMVEGRISFLGLEFDNVDMKEALSRIEQFIQLKKPSHIFTPNVALLVWARKDPFLRHAYNSCDLLTVDGMAIYYALRLVGTPVKESLSASVLFHPLLRLSQEKEYKIYMVGAREEVVKKAVHNLGEEFPGLRIVGHHHGFFDTAAPPEELIRDIREKEPDIMLVGMSSPHKERFITVGMQNLCVPVSLAVGGMFDIAAGEAKFAPVWIRKLCLEWLYRLAQEPRRMWKRYLTTNSVFLWLLLRVVIKVRILDVLKNKLKCLFEVNLL